MRKTTSAKNQISPKPGATFTQMPPFWFVLVLGIVGSALFIVRDAHLIRMGNIELNVLYQEEIRYLEQHGRLLLERSTLLSPYRLELMAAHELDMRIPTPEDIEVLP